jgi:uncharacterized protein (UPF0261 family)
MSKKIVVIGAFDTKANEYKFVIDLLKEKEYQLITINTGVLGSTDLFHIDIPAERVAEEAGSDLYTLQKANDRGRAIAVMSEGASKVVDSLFQREHIDGIIGMGGTAGTNVVTSAMRTLPFGIPKICISTVASGDVSPYLQTTDIIMVPSLTDISGINSFSKVFLTNAVGALEGILERSAVLEKGKPIIAASMFGNTTPCLDKCRQILNEEGFEVLVFHATGSGGKTMEKLICEGAIQGVLDITTTEWADTLCGGVFDAGTERLDGPGKVGIPHLIAPGCLDMCNFGSINSVPSRYKDRLFYQWNPNVTLMRTTVEENRLMGEIFAEKANKAKGKISFIIPMKGFSMLDSVNENGEAQVFWDPSADKAFIEGLKKKLNPTIEVEEIDANINDALFAKKAVEKLLLMMEYSNSYKL